jgi:hypothetical protein
MSQSLVQSSLQTEASLGCHPALDCREINSGLMKIEAVCLSVLDRRPEPQPCRATLNTLWEPARNGMFAADVKSRTRLGSCVATVSEPQVLRLSRLNYSALTRRWNRR